MKFAKFPFRWKFCGLIETAGFFLAGCAFDCVERTGQVSATAVQLVLDSRLTNFVNVMFVSLQLHFTLHSPLSVGEVVVDLE